MAPTLIFDGDCAFCTSTANWLGRRLPPGVEVVPWQSVELDAVGLTVEDVTTAAYWLDVDGRPHRGHRAVGAAFRAMGGAWVALGWLCLLPPMSWLAAVGYRLVAANRHRLPGGTPECRLDRSDDRAGTPSP